MSSPGEEASVVITRSLRIPLSELHLRFGPSGGPGGQHANKVATRVELRFDVAASSALAEYQRERLLDRLGSEVRVVVDEERSQARNRRLAVERFRERMAAALRVEKPRRPTRPSAGATERRLTEKRRLSERKRARRPPIEE
ncbi:MAG: alternative ribosome rescue aminoacyl-tRNA hydrolase ArfB [Acidimicrobiales bacterium]